MTEAENPFSMKTATTPRPAADQPAYQFVSSQRLAVVQRLWDVADDNRKKREALVANAEHDRKAKLDSQAATAQAIRDKRLAEQSKTVVNHLRGKYLAAGGTVEGWDKEKDSIVAEHA